jgi:hypothetical protein
MNMSSVTAEGFDKPYNFDFQPYAVFGNRTPVLRGFYLGYDIGVSRPADHEVNLVQVLAGGHSEDLSPSADLPPSNLPDGKLWSLLQDAEPEDEKFYYKVSHSLIESRWARRFQIRDVGCVGECVQPLPNFSSGPLGSLFPPVFALVGFELFFTGDRDYKLDRIGVWFDQGNDLHVALGDAAANETFGYLVDFVVIPTRDLNVYTESAQGTANGGVRFPTKVRSKMDFLIRGWEFNFRQSERRIRDIGVFPDQDNLDVSVIYADNSSDDPFDWRVDYGYVSPKVLTTARRSA